MSVQSDLVLGRDICPGLLRRQEEIHPKAPTRLLCVCVREREGGREGGREREITEGAETACSSDL